MTFNIDNHIKSLGADIEASFWAKVGDAKPTPVEQQLVARCATRLASVSVYMPGADATTAAVLELIQSSALATVQNVSIGVAVRADMLMRQAVYETLLKIIQTGISLAVTAAVAA